MPGLLTWFRRPSGERAVAATEPEADRALLQTRAEHEYELARLDAENRHELDLITKQTQLFVHRCWNLVAVLVVALFGSVAAMACAAALEVPVYIGPVLGILVTALTPLLKRWS